MVDEEKLRFRVPITNFMVVFLARDRAIGLKCPMFRQTELVKLGCVLADPKIFRP